MTISSPMEVVDSVLAAAAVLYEASSSLRRTATDIRKLITRDTRSLPNITPTILLVHDDPAASLTLWDALREVGTVHLANTVNEAKVALRRHQCAVIVADYGLGNDTAATLLSERHPAHKAVLISARVPIEELRPVARGVGAHLMATPMDALELAALLDLVKTLLRESYYT